MKIEKLDKNSNLLPFEFNKKLSASDISKKLKSMAISTVEYNKYMNKFFFNSNYIGANNISDYGNYVNTTNYGNDYATAPNLKLKDKLCITENDEKSYNSYFKTELNLSLSTNQAFMEKKYLSMCESVNQNLMVKNSRIRNFINFNTNSRKKLILPKLMPSPSDSKSMKIKFSQEYIDNLFDLFYLKNNLTNKQRSSIIHSVKHMKIYKIEVKISELVKGYSQEKLDLNSNISYKFDKILYKKFNENLEQEMHLTIKPLSIQLTDVDSPLNKINFNLPFELVPLLSVCSHNNLIEFFTSILEFSTDFKDIFLNERKIKVALRQLEFFKNLNYNSDSFFKYKFNNLIHFNWSTPNYMYDVVITPPSIELNIKNKNILIKKLIEINFLLFILIENLEYWEFYTVNYLLFEKTFRDLLNQVFSKIEGKNFNSFMNNNNRKVISLDKKKLETNYFNFSVKLLTFVYTTNNENSTNKNFLINIKSFSATYYFKKEKHYYQFNFDQSIKLFRLAMACSLNFVLERILYFDNDDKLRLNEAIFNDYDQQFSKIVKEFRKVQEIDVQEQDIRFNLIKCSLESCYLDENNIIKNEDNLVDNELFILFSLDKFIDWIINLRSKTDKCAVSKLYDHYNGSNGKRVNFSSDSNPEKFNRKNYKKKTTNSNKKLINIDTLSLASRKSFSHTKTLKFPMSDKFRENL